MLSLTLAFSFILPLSFLRSCSLHEKRLQHVLYDNQLSTGTAETTMSSLPVFPLRKAVRVPTEALTLNLYEERYLEMSQCILREEEEMLFGAVYSSDKPQIVRGNGPIVPLVGTGDVGVLFKVVHHDEAIIPTVGSHSRRRIRLEAVGIGRFVISKIVHPGYVVETPHTPYIVAEVELIMDDEPEDTSDLRETLSRLVLSGGAKLAEDGTADIGSILDRDQYELVRDLYSVGNQLQDDKHDELFSFSVASYLRQRIPSREMMSLLRMKSTRMRLESLIQVADRRQLSFHRFWSSRFE